jgi:predicted nucleic acid-binding protein
VLLVDTNVLLDVLENDPVWADWSIQQLRAQAQVHELAIDLVVYSEVSLAFDSVDVLDRTLDEMELAVVEPPRPALFLAARAFAKYKRSGGARTNVLPDFFIGAHAAVVGCPLLTRDPRRYLNYFPKVKVISPDGAPQ